VDSPLNGPLEVGMRVLLILVRAYPERLDLSRLVLLDHGILHSADLGGPESLHPPLPVRAGELGVKRTSIEQGLQVMLRAEMVEMESTPQGIEFIASDAAYSFVSVLTSDYVRSLTERAVWLIDQFTDLSESVLRNEMQTVLGGWSEEFTPVIAESDWWAMP
jgi:hypothetical protein